MGFRRSDLQEPFFVPGTWPFQVWGYGTTDPLEEILGQSYFRSTGGLMHPGDPIYVSVRSQLESRLGLRPTGGPGVAGRPVSLRPQLVPEPGELRMALVMVRAGENGAPSVRLVQDLGCPDDPDAPLAAADLARRSGGRGAAQAPPRPPAGQQDEEAGGGGG
jgi:hypothetical protein